MFILNAVKNKRTTKHGTRYYSTFHRIKRALISSSLQISFFLMSTCSKAEWFLINIYSSLLIVSVCWVAESWSLLTLHTSDFSCKSLLQIWTSLDFLGMNDWNNDTNSWNFSCQDTILRCWIYKKISNTIIYTTTKRTLKRNI